MIDDVETLCVGCHRKAHGFGPRPEYGPREFDELLWEINWGLRYIDKGRWDLLPSEADIARLARLSETKEDEREVGNLIRHKAHLRILLSSDRAWRSWIGKSSELKGRLWRWSEEKFESMKEREDLNVRQAFSEHV